MALACSIAFIALRIAMSEGLGGRAPTLILLAAPLVASWFGGWGPGLLATLLCTFIGELALAQPGQAFGWPNGPDEWGRVVMLFAYGLIFSGFNESRLRSLRIASARQENLLRAQQELALREQRMRETLEASPAAMVVVNRAGLIELVNSQAGRLFGWDREQLVGQPIDLLVPEPARHQHAAHRATFHANPSARVMGAGRDLRARRRDGTEFPVEVGLTPLQGSSSGLVLATVIDISSRQEAAAALRENAERLRETDSRKDDFIAVLAHELRNPLAPVRSAVEIMRRLDPGDPRLARIREVIARQVDHMTRLIDDLLDVSRIGRGKLALRFDRCNLAQIARDTAEDYQASLESEGLRLLIDVPETPIWVEGDAVRLAQMLGNLLNNAGRFSHAGGLITVEVRVDMVLQLAMMRVADTGVGIGSELLGRLFNPFEQGAQDLSRSRGGLGLGLALTQGLATLHGGHIEAKSPGPDLGATFTLWLPLASEHAGERPGADPVSASPPPTGSASTGLAPVAAQDRSRLRILVVEDNLDAAETLGELLALSGHEVEVCHDGEAGVALAKQGSPDVLISDLGLPGEMDGYQLARRLRADPQQKGLYLIALSGYADGPARARSQEAGFDAHLPKPPDIQQLEALLLQVARRGVGQVAS